MGVSALAYSNLALEAMLSRLEVETGFHLNELSIPADMSFRQWCEKLGEDGLKVDGHSFNLGDRKALHFIYDLIPTTEEEGFGKTIALMKGAQMGLTVWEMLANIYMALKFAPLSIGMYLPSRDLASIKSENRFMRMVRTIPDVYRKMVSRKDDSGKEKNIGEGNKLTRSLGESLFYFMWTSGGATTESIPMDAIGFDEVQGMTIADIDTTMERMSASRLKFVMLLSTAKWPDSDIHYWFKQGKQFEFWTECDSCGKSSVLSEHYPDTQGEDMHLSIRFDSEKEDFVYCCPFCNAEIIDSQKGGWVARHPERKIWSVHPSQFLSPTITPRELYETWGRAETGDQKQNWYNRKRGEPYADPSMIPVSLAHLNQCAADGMAAGVVWKTSARGTFMGIDQMGNFNVAILKERLDDGRQAVIHVRIIYDADPFEVCTMLMKGYGVDVCVVETLPNYNDAKRFANKPEHRGRVFLASYSSQSDMVVWGDQLTRADRKTDESERDRYAVRLNQFKAMDVSLRRFVKRQCVFPDPGGLVQDIVHKGERKRVAVLKDEVFLHLTRIALMRERDDGKSVEGKGKGKSAGSGQWKTWVEKVGIDPHFAYANMLCDVAWARSHGTTMFIIPKEESFMEPETKTARGLAGVPDQVIDMMEVPRGDVCGRCDGYDRDRGKWCKLRTFIVQPKDPGCRDFIKDKYS